MINDLSYRKTSQYLNPAAHPALEPGQYDIYPGFSLPGGKIISGFEPLAQALSKHKTIVMDGFGGVIWADFRERLEAALLRLNLRPAWYSVDTALRPPEEITCLIEPFLGGKDPLFGTRFQGKLADFFDPQRLLALQPDPQYQADLHILYGCGAALAGWEGLLVYLDVPKNEIQFRSRAGSITNLGAVAPRSAKEMYKQFYFVDWVALNQHKAGLLPQIDWIVDAQRIDAPAAMRGEDLRAGLHKMSRSFFRVRPWFEPGPWGGQWIKKQVPQLAQQVPNYAWSFELISPENGLAFESGGLLLEVSFDMLMFQEYQAVLGRCAPSFRYEFPIRYDFLDTVEGGNLSIQCHPRPEYVRQHFGETFTQDECYYILDCDPGARVYLGFQEDIQPPSFKSALLASSETGQPVEVDRYVNSIAVEKHDFLLIPNGTIHGAGRGNLILEISATPYIFTFKMYDWMRLDLDGKPRSLNIERAFQNLYFDRRGERIRNEFVSHPRIVQEGEAFRIVHVPTHPAHFYDVHRLEFSGQVEVETGGPDGSCHVLSLVEGKTVLLETSDGSRMRFNYAETFVVPAAAGRYRLISEDHAPIKVIKTFIKPNETWEPGVLQ